MKLKKITAVLAAALLTMTAMTACSGGAASSASSETPSSESSAASAESASSESTSSESASSEETTGGDMTGEITVLSREDGSGTLSAFTELFGIEEMVPEAIITNSTAVMLTSVAGDPAAIGYVSMGSLNETVKAVSVDGNAATVEGIKDGSYTLARPFVVTTYGEVGEIAQDLLNYIMSAEGQAIINEEGYIAIDDAAAAYTAAGVSGEITVGGSSSVTPVMEKLAEAYMALNPDVTVVVQQSDSTTGVTGSDWSWAKSLGNAFQDSGVWKYRHGYGSTNQLAGDIYGDGTDAPVAFLGDTGAWKALPANLYYGFPNIYNTWEAGFKNNNRPISYKPRTGGVYQTYDSGDPAVIDEHLAMIADAGIDYLLFDLTNHVNADNAYIKNRAKAVAERIRIWNQDSAHRKIRYAVGIGGIQMTHSPSTVEEECTIIYDEFFSQSIGGDNYYQINGKPLIVTYAEYADRLGWEQSTISKTSSNRFTVEWMQGTLTGTNASGQPPLADIGRYYGWTYPNGSIASTGTMVAQPGHNNYVGTFISRQYNGVNGGFYSTQCWQRILQQKPQNVVINSFNEFAEETAVQPSDTAGLTSPSEKWYNQNGQLDPDMYWNMTKQYIAQLRQ